MITFKEFCFKDELLREFDEVIKSHKPLNEGNMGDLDIANIIMKNLDMISLPSIKSIMGIVSVVWKHMGKKAKDIMGLFTPEGIGKVKEFIANDVIGSKELKYILKTFDPTKYKGYTGLVEYVKDMKKNQPELFNNLIKGITHYLQ